MSLNLPITHWQHKRVWLVGASTGIGRATAELLHQRGAKVIASARNAAALGELAAQCPGLQSLPLDAGNESEVLAAAIRLLAQGPIDLVVYCAGTYSAMRAQEMNSAQIAHHMQVNYLGAVHTIAAILPDMLSRGAGHICVVSSVAGFRGLPKSLAYGPTKAALINLAETLYMDVHDAGVGVSVVNPGFVQTPLTAQNNFHMPALITSGQAAIKLIAGLELGLFEIHFPKRFTRFMKLLRLLPYSVYFRITRRFTGL